MSYSKKVLIVSAINFFEGGPLSVLLDCLAFLDKSQYNKSYTIICLVHKKELFKNSNFENIKFIEFPKSRKSYLYRFYYEYYFFKKFAVQHKVDFWFSMHDITPSLNNIEHAVYCHNPTPFLKLTFRDLFLYPKLFMFTLLYRYLYQINIKKNKYVVVQQNWIRDKFVSFFDLDSTKIIVAKPQVKNIFDTKNVKKIDNSEKIFFFPTVPRSFKNIEVICEATKILNQKNVNNFKVYLTIDGSENSYSKRIVRLYHNVQNIQFIGQIKREAVYLQYAQSDCLIFPSKLETWGLPITEFKAFNKPMLVADLPYAKETVGDYDKALFFDPDDSVRLAEMMDNLINNGKLVFKTTTAAEQSVPYSNSWQELFQLLLN